MSLRCLFIVQGEGRGHLTQALALRRLLREADHRVPHVVVGQSDRRRVPRFFAEKVDAPLSFIQSPNFVADADHRTVRPWATLARGLTNSRRLYRELGALRETIEHVAPDVVINFFEPMAGWAYLRYAPAPPLVCVAHQYMFMHPAYRFPPGRPVSRMMARAFARSTAFRADRCLALSLYPAESPTPQHPVMPPLLRPQLFDQPLGRTEPFFLVYLVNSGYADEVIRWHDAHPEVRLHCFWDRPGAATVETYDDTLTFHQLDDTKFLSLMARCQGLVSTAGFESIAEAMYLDKPVQVVPVEGHFEQWCNAFDTVRAGAGIRSTRFDLTRLQRYLQSGRARRHDAERFRRWVEAGRTRFVREIEAAVRGTHPPAPETAAPHRVLKPTPTTESQLA